MMMKTSARNCFNGVVIQVEHGAANSEVLVGLPGGQRIAASLSQESVGQLGLEAGREAAVLVKAGSVIIATDLDGIRLSECNCLSGTVRRIETGTVNAVVELDIGGGTSVYAGITVGSCETLQLSVGQQATAVFKPAAVILGVRD